MIFVQHGLMQPAKTAYPKDDYTRFNKLISGTDSIDILL